MSLYPFLSRDTLRARLEECHSGMSSLHTPISPPEYSLGLDLNAVLVGMQGIPIEKLFILQHNSFTVTPPLTYLCLSIAVCECLPYHLPPTSSSVYYLLASRNGSILIKYHNMQSESVKNITYDRSSTIQKLIKR